MPETTRYEAELSRSLKCRVRTGGYCEVPFGTGGGLAIGWAGGGDGFGAGLVSPPLLLKQPPILDSQVLNATKTVDAAAGGSLQPKRKTHKRCGPGTCGQQQAVPATHSAPTYATTYLPRHRACIRAKADHSQCQYTNVRAHRRSIIMS